MSQNMPISAPSSDAPAPRYEGDTYTYTSPVASPTRWVRDLFTGELKEVPSEGGGRQIIFRGALPKHYNPNRADVNPWSGKDKVCRPLSLKPEEVTPERIAAENEACRRHGTGAWYDSEGVCRTPTRGTRARETARPKLRSGIIVQQMDNDAGYSDHAGR